MSKWEEIDLHNNEKPFDFTTITNFNFFSTHNYYLIKVKDHSYIWERSESFLTY